MNKSIADIAHDIIAKVNDNKFQIDILREKLKPSKDKVQDRIDSILLSKMCMDAEDVIREFNIINARVHRQGEELRNIGHIIDCLPNTLLGRTPDLTTKDGQPPNPELDGKASP